VSDATLRDECMAPLVDDFMKQMSQATPSGKRFCDLLERPERVGGLLPAGGVLRRSGVGQLLVGRKSSAGERGHSGGNVRSCWTSVRVNN
jgi:hypothetical protein